MPSHGGGNSTAAARGARSVAGSRLRADAQENRARILAAALDVFIEEGPGAALEDISRRAGTGIATLYRRFPNRTALMVAVVLDALQRTVQAAQEAADEEPDPFEALAHYMHRALDIRAAAVIPGLLQSIPFDDPTIARARDLGSRRVQELVDAAHQDGSLHPDVSSGDIGVLVVRLSRPLAGPLDRGLKDALAHRHLDMLLNGLRAIPADHTWHARKPTGPTLTLKDLNDMHPTRADQA